MSDDKKLVRSLTGKVISTAMDKTIVVLVTRTKKHPFGKYITLSSKIHAHDAENICQKDDVVTIQECRPLSKTKSWTLASVVEKARG